MKFYVIALISWPLERYLKIKKKRISLQLSFSPTTPGWSHVRLVGLLSSILTISGFMFIICICVGFFGGMNTFAFMAAEVSEIRTLNINKDVPVFGVINSVSVLHKWRHHSPHIVIFNITTIITAQKV